MFLFNLYKIKYFSIFLSQYFYPCTLIATLIISYEIIIFNCKYLFTFLFDSTSKNKYSI